ncbi:MAG TPA: hypothetical protein VF668_19095, partial [Pyrinomonadaceae bacterium]
MTEQRRERGERKGGGFGARRLCATLAAPALAALCLLSPGASREGASAVSGPPAHEPRAAVAAEDGGPGLLLPPPLEGGFGAPAAGLSPAPAAGLSPAQGAAGVNDRRVYPEPPAPRLPAAGGTFRDPAFGAEVMRVTDERDGAGCGNFYPHWPTLNADSTRLLVRRQERGDAVYEFDPAAFRLGRARPVPRLPDNGVLITEGAIWSPRDPNVLYGATFNGPYLWALDVSRQTYRLVKDFSREPGFRKGDYLWQMSVSADEDVFAFTHRDASYKPVGHAVWRRSDDRLLVNSDSTVEDEVRLDKSGRYLVRYLSRQVRGFDCFVQDLRTGREEGLTPDAPDFSPGHGDVGAGMLVAWDNNDNRFLRRALSDPHRFTAVLEMGRDWMNQHLSLLSRDDAWALVTFYSYRGQGLAPGLFHDELVLVKTDGSGQFRRLLQHRSKAQDYWAMPRANISYDGRFAA